MKKVIVVLLLLVIGAGGLLYYRARQGGFDMDKYRETLAKAQQALAMARQALNAPPGDLAASLQGTSAGRLIEADRRFFQELASILAAGASDCAGAAGRVEALKQRNMQARAQLAAALDPGQATPLMGLAFLQISLERLQALEPSLAAFVASCPRDSKVLGFLLEDGR